jgi:hypothetical protein
MASPAQIGPEAASSQPLPVSARSLTIFSVTCLGRKTLGRKTRLVRIQDPTTCRIQQNSSKFRSNPTSFTPGRKVHLELSRARVSQYFRAAMARCQRQCGPQILGQTEGKIPISSEIWLTKNGD